MASPWKDRVGGSLDRWIKGARVVKDLVCNL